MPKYESFVAIGDSFTEGMNDVLPDGSMRGWADRLAYMLAEGNPDFAYANLALRGKEMQHILDEQLPVALKFQPDLVSICAGGNDVIIPGRDVDEIGAQFDDMVRQFTEAGIEVLMFTGPDTRELSILNRVRPKVAIYNAHLHAIAERWGAHIVDLWAMAPLRDMQAYSSDRLHFSPEAHRRIALRAAEVLGIETAADWREPWPEHQPPTWLDLRRSDVAWTKTHLIPWIGRILRGESLGDGMDPKRPRLERWMPPVGANPAAEQPAEQCV